MMLANSSKLAECRSNFTEAVCSIYAESNSWLQHFNTGLQRQVQPTLHNGASCANEEYGMF